MGSGAARHRSRANGPALRAKLESLVETGGYSIRDRILDQKLPSLPLEVVGKLAFLRFPSAATLGLLHIEQETLENRVSRVDAGGKSAAPDRAAVALDFGSPRHVTLFLSPNYSLARQGGRGASRSAQVVCCFFVW